MATIVSQASRTSRLISNPSSFSPGFRFIHILAGFWSIGGALRRRGGVGGGGSAEDKGKEDKDMQPKLEEKVPVYPGEKPLPIEVAPVYIIEHSSPNDAVANENREIVKEDSPGQLPPSGAESSTAYIATATPTAPVPLPAPIAKMSNSQDDLLASILNRNREWATRTAATNPALFPALAQGQSPQILWYGCSDSRVPETTVLDLQPGEVFVHRNIANLLPANDLSSLSVLQYAVEVLQVKHIIVCGHYGCGGVNAALGHKKLGLIDSWLRGVREVRAKYDKQLASLTPKQQSDKLVELNVMEQVRSVLKNANVQEAMEERGLEVHGWVYNIGSGECHMLECPVDPDAHVFTVKDPRKELLN